MKNIKIEKINYFGNKATGTDDWNAKVVYLYKGQRHIALVDICFFSKQFYSSQALQKKYSSDLYTYKLYNGVCSAIAEFNPNYFSL